MADVRAPFLKNRADLRQLGIVATYFGLLFGMYFVPAMRNPVCLVLACLFSFLTAVVNHNTMHQALFTPKWANDAWKMLLSFGALYPVTTNVPAHNLVHHHFDDEGQPDWAAPQQVRFSWNLLNLLHFPNAIGTTTFFGTQRWMRLSGKGELRKQFTREQIVAFGLTGALLAWDFWTALFFVVVPQLWGARAFLRINIIQHDGCDTRTEWNHSRNFVGRVLNWFMCNNGYHTIHHNRAGLHWTALADAHAREVVPKMDPRLDEPSIAWYLFRTYVLNVRRPIGFIGGEREVQDTTLAPREARRAEAEAQAA